MEVKKTKIGNETKITFIPQTTEEKLIMGTLRNHYFFGISEDGTFPMYDGITSEDNLVTSMSLKFYAF